MSVPFLSLTEGWRAQELFTNRREEIALFTRLVDAPPPQPVLYFHADGGNGKSLLLRVLADTYAVDEGLASATLDFGAAPTGEDRPQEPFSGLLILRRQLSAANLSFFAFDFAVVWYLKNTGHLTADRVRELLPNAEVGLLTSIVDLVSQSSWGALASSLLSLLNARAGEAFTVWSRKRNLNADTLNGIIRLRARTELVDALPVLFALDVNASMTRHPLLRRLIFFFDGHEAFWRDQRAVSTDLYFQRDEWFRRLLGSLDPALGILTVVAGREPPRWSEAPRFAVPVARLQLHHLGHFDEPAAVEYLTRAGIESPAIRGEILNIASVAPGELHPLYLGLCADVFLTSSGRGHTPEAGELRSVVRDERLGGEVIARLLRYSSHELEYAVRALAACRAFDPNLYYRLGEALHFRATAAEFALLRTLSFVWPHQQPGRHRIHDLIRRLLHEEDDPIVREAHAFLEQVYGASSDAASVAEASYHANQLDPERGARQWLAAVDDAIEMSRYDDARTLLQILPELTIRDPLQRAKVLRLSSDLAAAYAQFDEARRGYTRALRLLGDQARRSPSADVELERGVTLMKEGDLFLTLSANAQALAFHRKALAAVGRAVEMTPDDPLAWSSRAYALLNIGDALREAGRVEDALAAYHEAIPAAHRSLELRPAYLEAIINEGYALASIGETLCERGELREGIGFLERGSGRFDDALRISATARTALTNLAWALGALIAAYTEAHRDEDAESAVARLAPVLDAAVAVASQDMFLIGSGSFALMTHADTIAGTDPDHARALYQRALEVLREARTYAPADPKLLINEGFALMGVAALEAAADRADEAETTYRAAIDRLDAALTVAPNDVTALQDRATARNALAGVIGVPGREDEALAMRRTALEDARRLALHSSNPLVVTEIANIVSDLGDALIAAGHSAEALGEAEAAITLLRPLQGEPGIDSSHLVVLLMTRAGAEEALSRPEDALASFAEAVRLSRASLEEDPEEKNYLENLFESLLGTARILMAEDRDEEALAPLEEAYTVAARKGMEQPHSHRANALDELARLSIGIGDYARARERLEEGLREIDAARDEEDAPIFHAWLLMRYGELEAALGHREEALAHDQAAREVCDRAGRLERPQLYLEQVTLLTHVTDAQVANDREHYELALRVCDAALAKYPHDLELREQRQILEEGLAALAGEVS